MPEISAEIRPVGQLLPFVSEKQYLCLDNRQFLPIL
jgi:hypothetical protein